MNKAELKKQIKANNLKEKRARSKMHAEEEAGNDLIKNDETLMAIYPKIKAMPDHLKKIVDTQKN